ncbi:MAG: penicillin acylase family protein [Fidelibacterota bacterium]
MKLWIQIGLVIVGIILVVVLFGRIYLDYPLPPYEGEVTLKGLEHPVEVYFDAYAVPHIYAENEHDLFFAAGYIAARERLFQMTVNAAAVQGKLAELFGEGAVADDIYLRTWGIPRMARILGERMNPEARTISGYFCDGINAYIDEAGRRLPVEFKLLGIEPIRWEPAYVAGVARLMGHNLTASWKPEIVLGQVATIFDEKKAREVWPYNGEKTQLAARDGGRLYGLLGTALLERDRSVRAVLGMAGDELGSNNWVISGERTVSGKPILANDPHLPYSQPATWYEMHLVGGRFNVSGACLAGIPVPVLGQNEAAAWGFTNLMVDDVDFFVETVDPRNPNRYLYDGQWRDMELREETIFIKGGGDTTVTIRKTVHGPVISDIHPLLRNGEKVVSMRWAGHDASDEIYALLQLTLMKDWEDFSYAARFFGVPGQNVVYADTAGNIGWRPFARIPIRKGGPTVMPVPGTSPEWDWKGYVPFDDMPFVLNPPSGLIATANNKVFDDSYPYYVSAFWQDPSRVNRILELLGDKNRITVEMVKRTQTDVVSPFAREVAPYFVEASKADTVSPNPAEPGEPVVGKGNLARAIHLLEGWDGDHSVESAAAAVFNASLLRLFKNIYGDEMRLMGEGFYEGWLSLGSLPTKDLRRILTEGSCSWCDNIETRDAVETIDDLLRQSLREGVRDLEKALGPDPANWKWGRLHTVTYGHHIGVASPILDFFFHFNVGPFPSGGTATTVNKGEFLLNDPYDHVVGPSFRRIVDFSNLDETQFIIPTGQSGLPKSVHYDDQAGLYLSGKYRTTYFSRERVEQAGVTHLLLSPAG